MTETLDEYIKSRCWSCWDGCSCDLPRDHEGLHKCGCDTCDCSWTDEQEREFMRSMGFKV